MLVQIRNQMQRDTVREDRQLLEQQKKRIDREIQLEQENMRKKKTLAKELLDMSLKDKERRHERDQRELRKENRAFKAKLEDLERAELELREMKKREKTRTGKEIQDYYERHLQMKKERERRDKLRDKEYLEMEIAKLEKEERDRVDFFEKIKSGYKQNRLVQQKYQEFYQERQKRLKEFDEKIINRPFQEKIERDRQKEEQQALLSKMMQSQNKLQLKRQIRSKKQEDLEKWRNELEYEKAVVSHQMSRP